jgi:hypothetical protein
VYTVARLSCFRDERLADIYECCIHSNSGYRWKDFGGIHWVSPASEQVQDYLVTLAVELAELGFDEILLTDLVYPTQGKLDKIAYGTPEGEFQPTWTAEQINGLLSAVKEALGDRDVKLSLEITAAAAANGGVDAAAGSESAQSTEAAGADADAAAAVTESAAGDLPDET